MNKWKIFHIITGNRFFRIVYARITMICRIVPDVSYLHIMYWIRMRQRLNLKNPITFNEKIQWLKLYYKDKNYGRFVDKYMVRDYIDRKIGGEYLIPLIGVYDRFEDIQVDELPQTFVVKCTHDSGSVVLCNSKDDLLNNKYKLKTALNRKYYLSTRDYSYKGIKPRIVIEKRLKNDSKGLRDYKFYCFNGEPRFLYISEGLEDHSTARISFYNLDFSIAPFCRADYRQLEYNPDKPRKYDEMLDITRKLSKDFVFVRVDLYYVDDHIYFSELTFAPCGGYMPLKPIEYDRVLGDYLDISFCNR